MVKVKMRRVSGWEIIMVGDEDMAELSSLLIPDLES